MISDRCEIFHVRCQGKLRWKWRYLCEDRAPEPCEEEYELFYECLSAARDKGLTPTYPGLRLEQPHPRGGVTLRKEIRPAGR